MIHSMSYFIDIQPTDLLNLLKYFTIHAFISGIKVQPISRTSRLRRETPLPEYWDWNDKGIVRPVQDQGRCSSCYAFASIGAIEAAACKTLGQCQKLSEQEAMECTGE